jgi:hypothetical protein
VAWVCGGIDSVGGHACEHVANFVQHVANTSDQLLPLLQMTRCRRAPPHKHTYWCMRYTLYTAVCVDLFSLLQNNIACTQSRGSRAQLVRASRRSTAAGSPAAPSPPTGAPPPGHGRCLRPRHRPRSLPPPHPSRGLQGRRARNMPRMGHMAGYG